MNTSFTPATESIKNLKDSNIAYLEKNDCVVRAIASASEWEYDTAHKFVEDNFNRKFGCGTDSFGNILTILAFSGTKLNNKSIDTIIMPHYKLESKLRMTVGSFIKKHNIGVYILYVNGHAFSIKNGGVIGGNLEDSIKMKRIIKGAWELY